MNIPSAEQARAKVQEGQYAKANQQFTMVEEKILAAIADGKTTCGGDGSLESPVKQQLENLGYKCSSDQQYNESYWSISW